MACVGRGTVALPRLLARHRIRKGPRRTPLGCRSGATNGGTSSSAGAGRDKHGRPEAHLCMLMCMSLHFQLATAAS
eukprot:364114-Chlamydomonas_euryale.AAC.1